MRKSFFSYIGAVVVLAFVSVVSIAAPPGDAEASEIARMVACMAACQTADVTYEHAEQWAPTGAKANLLTPLLDAHHLERMPDFSASLIGDTGTSSLTATLVSQESGVSTAGTKSTADWSIA